MKKIAAVIVMTLILIGSAFAKDKKYDQTGTVAYSSFNSNAEAHTTVNGQTYDAYCNVDATRADCRDTGGVFELSLADGSRATFFPLIGFPSQCCGNPILDSLKTNEGKFSYRLDHYYDVGAKKAPAICVPFVNEKGKSKEACYAIVTEQADPGTSGK